MYRSSYEAPDVAPSDDAVVLPDALNLPAHDLPVPPAPVDLTPVEPAGTVPPIPPRPPQPAAAPASGTPTVPLPMSPQVARVRNQRRLPLRALAFTGGAIVVAGIVVGTIAIVSGGGEAAPVARDQASLTAPSDSVLPGERGGPAPVRTAPPTATPAPTPVPVPVVPPAQAAPSEPPATRAPAPDPAPKSPPSAPSAPKPAPSTPSTPAAAPPLAFTGIKENRGPNLIGIEIVTSYTLSMTGQPGSTADVTYGWKDAGSVTFDPDGRATLDIGRSVLDLIPGNPNVRAEYSDGTEGDPIEMSRKDIPT
ncbi:hypothetical protein ACFVAE_10220 [Microbacterium sp. NPDC057659]|uniref:hypothetical protein n=1 Tax=Microbacterium sp. NPDC057659 TaxID=3346198 RepID=UPI00366BE584